MQSRLLTRAGLAAAQANATAQEPVRLRVASDDVKPHSAKRPPWWKLYGQDIRRYRDIRNRPALLIMLTNQGAWAVLQYRVSSAVSQSALPIAVKVPAIILMTMWQKVTEITTGISISPKARIEEGFVLLHNGNMHIHSDTRIGRNCFINGAMGVLLGDHDNRAPTIGNNVSIAPGVIILGGASIGDHVMIGPRVTITGHFRIGSGATILPGANIMEDVQDGGTVYPPKHKIRMLPRMREQRTPA